MGAKIAISGAFSSGKTTLFRALIKSFPILAPYPEFASNAKSLCPTLNWRNDDVRGYLRWAQILAERECECDAGCGLFDGSYVDLVAHEKAFRPNLPPISLENEPARYRITFLCNPAGIPIESNGIRETDESLRSQIQEIVRKEARRMSEHVVELKGDHTSRLAIAIAEIESVIHDKTFG
jgi:nicotinamide riboside kinase